MLHDIFVGLEVSPKYYICRKIRPPPRHLIKTFSFCFMFGFALLLVPLDDIVNSFEQLAASSPEKA